MLKILYVIYSGPCMYRISVMCIEIYGFISHFAVWGMTRVSTSSALYCIWRNTEDAEM